MRAAARCGVVVVPRHEATPSLLALTTLLLGGLLLSLSPALAQAALAGSDGGAALFGLGDGASIVEKDPLRELEDEFGSPAPGAYEAAPPSAARALAEEGRRGAPAALWAFAADAAASLERPRWLAAVSNVLIALAVAAGIKRLHDEVKNRWPAPDASARPIETKGAGGTSAGDDSAAFDFGPLMEALGAGDEPRWRQLVGKLPCITAQDVWGCTALHVAAFHGCRALAEALLACGAVVDAKEDEGETPLHLAARAGSVAVCDVLLARGAEPSPLNQHGLTPLLVAAHAGKREVCELLLKHGGSTGGCMEEDLPPLLASLLCGRLLAASTGADRLSLDGEVGDEAEGGTSPEAGAF